MKISKVRGTEEAERRQKENRVLRQGAEKEHQYRNSPCMRAPWDGSPVHREGFAGCDPCSIGSKLKLKTGNRWQSPESGLTI